MAVYDTWLKARTILFIISGLWILGGVAIDIANSGIYYYKTGDHTLLLDSTLGRIISSDSEINQKVTRIVSDGNQMGTDLVSYLKQQILESLIILGIIVFLAYKGLKLLFDVWIPRDQYNLGLKAFIFIFSLGFVLITGLVYNGVVNGEWTSPFVGVLNLFKNIPAILNTTGTGSPAINI